MVKVSKTILIKNTRNLHHNNIKKLLIFTEFGPADGPLGNTRKKPRDEVTSTSGCETDRTDVPLARATSMESDSGAVPVTPSTEAKKVAIRAREAEKQQELSTKVPDRVISSKSATSKKQSVVEKTESLKKKLLESKEQVNG